MLKLFTFLITVEIVFGVFEVDEPKYQVMFSNKPVLAQDVYPNNTYVIENYKQRKFLCHLPAVTEFKAIKSLEKTPNQIIEKMVGNCLELVTRDYWNFTLCIGQHVTQYHKDSDGVIRGKNLFLVGNYLSDKNWTNEELLTPPINKRSSFHFQKYTNGSLCTPNLSRSAEIRFICGTIKPETYVSSYYESSPCYYVFFVEVKELCNIPALYHFENEEVSTITCNSIVSREYFESQSKSANPDALAPVTKKNDLFNGFLEDESENVIYDEIMNVPANDINQVMDVIFKKFNLFPDIDKLPQKEKLKNVDMKTIIEREGDEKPILKWRLSYKEEVDFDKLIEKADNIQETSLNMDDMNIMSIKTNNLRNLGVPFQSENQKQIHKAKYVFKIVAP